MRVILWLDRAITLKNIFISLLMRDIEIIDFGLGNYREILTMQTSFFENLISEKKSGVRGKEYLLIGEHPPVITLGRKAKENNVLLSISLLKERGIETFHIGRGGDVTYHCPGQLILYPILDLQSHKLGVKDYVNLLEESVILLLREYGITADRIEGATGVWIDKGKADERKICAIGIKCSHFCTMHGLALNVTSDLSGFSMINPCGFIDKGVTSLQNELCLKQASGRKPSKENSCYEGEEISFEDVKKRLSDIFLSLIFPL